MNRGVALYKGRVYLGALDGRLIALDAKTGAVAWQEQTTPKDGPYAITGAPRIAKGLVVIGNAGWEYAVRGYVSAYDAETGKLAWKTYTVPGDPSQPGESEALRKAASTWSGDWWKAGGGGSLWDSIVYDPDLNMVYAGTGNGSPWYDQIRGKGDNLYVASIIALRADTGEQVWHYQTTPGDNWDYDATQPLLLATLTIDGQPRRDAGQREWFLLRPGSGKRHALISEPLHGYQLGNRHRFERTSYRKCRGPGAEKRHHRQAFDRGRTQLAAHFLQSHHRARVP